MPGGPKAPTSKLVLLSTNLLQEKSAQARNSPHLNSQRRILTSSEIATSVIAARTVTLFRGVPRQRRCQWNVIHEECLNACSEKATMPRHVSLGYAKTAASWTRSHKRLLRYSVLSGPSIELR